MNEDAQEKALTEQEFADAEAFEAKWHEEDKERYRQERLPRRGFAAGPTSFSEEPPRTAGRRVRR